jgi:hypothetical protein
MRAVKWRSDPPPALSWFQGQFGLVVCREVSGTSHLRDNASPCWEARAGGRRVASPAATTAAAYLRISYAAVAASTSCFGNSSVILPNTEPILSGWVFVCWSAGFLEGVEGARAEGAEGLKVVRLRIRRRRVRWVRCSCAPSRK